MAATDEATQKQINYINDLIKSRAIDAQLLEECADVIAAGSTRRQASDLIERLLDLPRLPKPEPYETFSEVRELLSSIPESAYAVPSIELEFGDHSLEFDNEISFFEVRSYRGRVYMRRLYGAPGTFRREKLQNSEVIAVATALQSDPTKYARLFSTHFSCCAVCSSPLTDDTSRKLGLGPTCRKRFGYSGKVLEEL